MLCARALMARPLLLAACLLLVACTAPAPPAPPPAAVQPKPAAPARTPAQLEIERKLAELDQIRKAPEFKYYGEGQGGPYSNWEQEIDGSFQSFNLSVKERLGVEELKALFREYVSTKGSESEATAFFRRTVSEAAGIKSP
jgi:hypothetical protein